MNDTRVVFMGTPEFAVPSLRALHDAGYDVVGVFTQPDRPAGRGQKLVACPVKKCAEELGLKVFQFQKLRVPEGVEALRELAPTVVVTAAFGQILTKELLAIPQRGTINVHASLLPRHRGAAPINQCILQGETRTGVTTMLTDPGIDTGDMLLKSEVEIGQTETAGELTERLSAVGAELLIRTLDGYLSGALAPQAQNPDEATYEPMLKKEMGAIDWTKSAKEISCKVNGLNPWPCATTLFKGGVLKLLRARETQGEGMPGTVITSSAKEGLIVACGSGALEVLEMQAPNSKAMTAKAYLMGKKIEIGTVLGE